MKVTKYPQSCLILEKDGMRLLIDPGVFVAEKYKAGDLGKIDAVLVTHEHGDHLNIELLRSIVGQSGITVVANESASKLSDGLVTKVVTDGEQFELAGFKIIAKELPHCAMPSGAPGPQNTGYIIDDNFFHPGDGVKIDDVHVDTSGVAVAGPDISPRDVVDFAKSVGCKKLIPLHYSNHVFPGSKDSVQTWFDWSDMDVEVLALADGESAEI